MNILQQFYDLVDHAPAGVLAMLFSIFVGYILKSVRFFNNRYIPLIVIPLATTAYCLMQISAHLAKGQHYPWLYLTTNVVHGIIYASFAWLFHAQVLKRFLDPHLFNDDGSTKFFNKPTDKSQ